jgi:caffeoyl-CoA O-methyltransferase
MNGRSPLVLVLLVGMGVAGARSHAQDSAVSSVDRQVEAFLDRHAGKWHDMNVPASDGKLLYDCIVKNHYTNALEIGTSTGHSAIWMAWALSKTGGKLITIEIDKSRYETALANFREAGLMPYIDARRADAHECVPSLNGPFDFVFCDADKGWYTKYFVAIAQKLEVGGCFSAHNVSPRGGASPEFVSYVKSLTSFETTFDNSGGGISFSTRISAD